MNEASRIVQPKPDLTSCRSTGRSSASSANVMLSPRASTMSLRSDLNPRQRPSVPMTSGVVTNSNKVIDLRRAHRWLAGTSATSRSREMAIFSSGGRQTVDIIKPRSSDPSSSAADCSDDASRRRPTSASGYCFRNAIMISDIGPAVANVEYPTMILPLRPWATCSARVQARDKRCKASAPSR